MREDGSPQDWLIHFNMRTKKMRKKDFPTSISKMRYRAFEMSCLNHVMVFNPSKLNYPIKFK